MGENNNNEGMNGRLNAIIDLALFVAIRIDQDRKDQEGSIYEWIDDAIEVWGIEGTEREKTLRWFQKEMKSRVKF